MLKYAVIAAFALMIIVTGVVGLRRTRSFSDYFLGGRNIGPWMTAFTYGTAYFSAVLFIGFAGKVGWGFGYSGLWIAAGNALLGVLGVWWLLGYRIKKMSVEYDVHTMAEYFEKRYDSPFLKMFAALSIFVFFIPYSAAVFIGLSYLFRSTFGIDYTLALVFMGGFTALYLVMGGYKSMTIIDVVFGMIMTVGVIILLAAVINQGQGIGNITEGLSNIDARLVSAVGPPGVWPLFSLVFLTSVAPFAMPQLVQKFYAVRDRRSIRIGMFASTFFALLVGGIGYFTGSTTRFFLNPENAPEAFDGGRPIFDALMPELLASIVPETLLVLMLLLILSASMSTLAALILVSSSSIAKDVYAGFINRDVDDKRLTLMMRVLSAVFIAISVTLAYFRPATIVSILGISWGAVGSVFLGPFIWGLFTKRASKCGAICSSTLGLATCLLLYFRGMPSPQSGTIGMLVSLVLTPVVSVLVPSRE